MKRTKVWQLRTTPIEYGLANNRGHSVTLYGAVGHCIKKVGYFKLGSSTNRHEFAEYLEELKDFVHVGALKQKPYLIIDGHSAHRACKSEMAKHFKPLFMPPHSCQFNSIESVWSYLKQSFRKMTAEDAIKSDADLNARVRRTWMQADTQKLQNLVGAN